MSDMSQFYTTADHFSIIPAIMLAMFACAILIFDFWIFPDPRQRKYLLIFVVLAELFAGFGLYRQQVWLTANGASELSGFNGTVTVDGFAIFFNWIFLVAAIIVAVASYKYLEAAGEHHGEYYALMLFAQCGMYFLATGTDLVTLFIGLELMALCFYVMVGFLRSDRRSNEAALKYLILGAFSSGFLVYGFSVMYGMSGSTKLAAITSAIQQRPAWDPMVFLALTTTSVGLLFKISAAPFHMWAPGRLRRRAHHGHRLSLRRLHGRVHGLSPAHLPRSPGLRARCLGAAALGNRRAHPHRGQPRRHQSDQHQAHAGL